MDMPIELKHYLAFVIDKKLRREILDWLNSNSATVIVDELWKAAKK